MVRYLHSRVRANDWLNAFANDNDSTTLSISTQSETNSLGVFLRQERGTYVTKPEFVSTKLRDAVTRLNVEVAFTLSCETTRMIFQRLDPETRELYMSNCGGTSYQVFESVDEILDSAISAVRKFQYLCLLRREKVVLIWDDNVNSILARAAEIEAQMLSLVRDLIRDLLTATELMVDMVRFGAVP